MRVDVLRVTCGAITEIVTSYDRLLRFGMAACLAVDGTDQSR